MNPFMFLFALIVIFSAVVTAAIYAERRMWDVEKDFVSGDGRYIKTTVHIWYSGLVGTRKSQNRTYKQTGCTMKVTAAIKNGTMPIGAVLCDDGTGERERTVILRPRWDAWRTGKDLGN